MNIDYNAVIEILKKFLDNDKIEILGISVGEERQVREAIKNLLTAYEKEKEKNKKINKYIEDRAKIGKDIQTFINKDYVEQEYISKDKIKPIQIIDLDGKIHNVYKIEEE